MHLEERHRNGWFSITTSLRNINPWIHSEGYNVISMSQLKQSHYHYYVVNMLKHSHWSCLAQDAKGRDLDLRIYKGKVLLVVNVASKWLFSFAYQLSYCAFYVNFLKGQKKKKRRRKNYHLFDLCFLFLFFCFYDFIKEIVKTK